MFAVYFPITNKSPLIEKLIKVYSVSVLLQPMLYCVPCLIIMHMAALSVLVIGLSEKEFLHEFSKDVHEYTFYVNIVPNHGYTTVYCNTSVDKS